MKMSHLDQVVNRRKGIHFPQIPMNKLFDPFGMIIGFLINYS